MAVRVKFHKGCYWVFADHQYKRKAWKIGTKDAAEKFAGDVRKGIKDTGKVSKVPDPTASLPTLSEYFLRFKAGHMKNVEPKTAESYAGAFTKHIEPELGSKALNELNRRKMKDFVDSLKEKKQSDGRPYARDTVRIIVSTLRKILAEALDDELIIINPASKLGTSYKKLKKVHEIDPFSEDEAIRFLEAASKFSPFWFPYLACLLHAGLRPGEGVALKWTEVDFKRRVLHVHSTGSAGRVGTTKTGKSRQVEMSDFLYSLLQDLLLQRKQQWETVPEYVFCSSTGSMADTCNIRDQQRPKTPKQERKKILSFAEVLEFARLKPRGLHQLRHSFATLHIQNGTPIEWVSRQLGHADVATTYKYYYHYLPERQKEKYTGALPAIGKKSSDNLIVMKAK